MLGFRGHFASKSRRYSTTWARFAASGKPTASVKPQSTRELEHDEQDTTLIVAQWKFVGLGYLTSGDTALARSAAARARERRQAARGAA